MVFNDKEELEPLDNVREIDVLLGVIQIVFVALGVPSNLIALVYFIGSNVKSMTSRFFRQIYIFISITDTLLLAMLFPTIEFSFTEDKSLFNPPFPLRNETACYIWGIVWTSLSEFSVYFVAVMSFARLYIVMYPQRQLKTYLGMVLGFSYITFCIVLKLILVLSHSAEYKYNTGECRMVSQKPSNFSSLDSEFYRNDIGVRVLSIIQLGLPIIPIIISVSLTLYKIYKSSEGTARAGGSSEKQREASITVIMVTLVYIACNLPVFINYILSIVWITNESTVGQSMTAYFNSNIPYYPGLLRTYLWPITGTTLVALNSFLNPIVYYNRIRNYRIFVRVGSRRLVGKAPSINDRAATTAEM